MSSPSEMHALLSVLKSEDRPFNLLELADRLSLTPEQARTICQELLTMDLVDLMPLPRIFGEREVDFGFVLTSKARTVIFRQVDVDPRSMMEKANTPKPS